jgi:hypothetical protein
MCKCSCIMGTASLPGSQSEQDSKLVIVNFVHFNRYTKAGELELRYSTLLALEGADLDTYTGTLHYRCLHCEGGPMFGVQQKICCQAHFEVRAAWI